MADTPQPPVTERRPIDVTHHGDTRVDDYAWLADADDPAVLAHLGAENDYAAASTAHLGDLRDKLYAEIEMRTQQDDLSVPSRRGPWWYYRRTVTGLQYPIFARCPATGDDWTPPTLTADEPIPGEEVLLDGNVEAADAAFFSIGAFSVSEDGALLGYSVDIEGDERFTIKVKDLVTGALLADQVEGAFYGLEWDAAGHSFYYLIVDDAWRPCEVRRHVLGSVDPDEVVYTEPDERFWVDLDQTTSRAYLLISSSSKHTHEYHLIDRARPDDGLQLVAARRDQLEYDVDHVVIDGRDELVIVHNGVVDGVAARDFAVSVAPVGDSEVENWRTVVAPQPGVRVLGALGAKNHLVFAVRREGISRVQVLGLDDLTAAPWEVEFGEDLYTAELGGLSDPESPYVRIGFSSMVTPGSTFDLDLESRELVLRKRTPVLNVDLGNYRSCRVWARADDGTEVPISLVHHRDVEPGGNGNPVLLYGYGSYETSIDPTFAIPRLSLLDRGVVYAIAHVRGGGELGRAWYEGGRLLTKRNTFTDFVAAADALVEQGWADPSRIVAMGGSAGGLLMGAVANLAPERFAGVLAQVPFVDNLTTMLDPSLPLTIVERDEWGDPLGDADAYQYIKGYAPYEQIDNVSYPPILAITSLHDTRVRYVEPAKWIARLRERAPEGGPYLLKTELDGGHGGASGRYRVWRDKAYEFAWVLDRLRLGI